MVYELAFLFVEKDDILMMVRIHDVKQRLEEYDGSIQLFQVHGDKDYVSIKISKEADLDECSAAAELVFSSSESVHRVIFVTEDATDTVVPEINAVFIIKRNGTIEWNENNMNNGYEVFYRGDEQ